MSDWASLEGWTDSRAHEDALREAVRAKGLLLSDVSRTAGKREWKSTEGLIEICCRQLDVDVLAASRLARANWRVLRPRLRVDFVMEADRCMLTLRPRNDSLRRVALNERLSIQREESTDFVAFESDDVALSIGRLTAWSAPIGTVWLTSMAQLGASAAVSEELGVAVRRLVYFAQRAVLSRLSEHFECGLGSWLIMYGPQSHLEVRVLQHGKPWQKDRRGTAEQLLESSPDLHPRVRKFLDDHGMELKWLKGFQRGLGRSITGAQFREVLASYMGIAAEAVPMEVERVACAEGAGQHGQVRLLSRLQDGDAFSRFVGAWSRDTGHEGDWLNTLAREAESDLASVFVWVTERHAALVAAAPLPFVVLTTVAAELREIVIKPAVRRVIDEALARQLMKAMGRKAGGHLPPAARKRVATKLGVAGWDEVAGVRHKKWVKFAEVVAVAEAEP